MRGKAGRAGRGLEEEKVGRGEKGGVRQGREGTVKEVEGRETEGRAGWGGGGEVSSALFGSFRGSFLGLSGFSFHAILLQKTTRPGLPSGLRITRKSEKSDSDFAYTKLIAK